MFTFGCDILAACADGACRLPADRRYAGARVVRGRARAGSGRAGPAWWWRGWLHAGAGGCLLGYGGVAARLVRGWPRRRPGFGGSPAAARRAVAAPPAPAAGQVCVVGA